MNEPKPGLARGTSGLLSVAFFLAGPILALAPLGMAQLLIAAAALAVATERAGNGRWVKPASQPAIVFTVFFVWCAVTLIWTLNPAEGARKLADLALVLASALVLQAAGERATQAQRRFLALALAGGMAVGLILLSVETAFDFPLYRAVMGRSDPRLADMVEAKRSVDALPLLVWPAALAVVRLGKTWLAVILLAVFTVASFKWTASSATLAMLASLVVLGLAYLSVKAVRRALMGATALAFALIVPFAIFAYDSGGATAGFLKHSAQHRLEIWHFAAERTLERPLFGYGFDSSRHIPNGGVVSAFQDAGKPIIPLHPHDGFLQIWLELGAAGAVLSVVALLAALRATAQWPDRSSRFALPGYAAALIVAGLAFGIWQTWWMATLAFSAIAFTTLAPGPDYA